MRLEAVIFDFDGLILDTEKAEFDSWCEVYREHGATLDFSDWSICIGTSGVFDPVTHLESLTGLKLDPVSVRARVLEIDRKHLDGMKLLPGVLDRLDEADALGIRVGLASSSSDPWVIGNLTEHGIIGRFSAIRTRTQVARPKPAPDLFLAAAAALGADPSRCVALEDSMNGIRSAKDAGMFCVAVPNSLTVQLDLSAADLSVPSLASFTLAQVDALMAVKR